MKTQHSLLPRTLAAFLAAALCVATTQARQGATDPIPGTSNGSTGGGGTSSGGSNSNKPGGSTTTTPAPAPAPVQPIVSGPLTFTASSMVNGVVPVCTGSYH